MSQPKRFQYIILSGGQRWNRTIDTRIFSPLLYRLSYLALEVGRSCIAYKVAGVFSGFGAVGVTRTPTSKRTLDPEPSASTNSATTACHAGT